jgi:hypothetical protein
MKLTVGEMTFIVAYFFACGLIGLVSAIAAIPGGAFYLVGLALWCFQ